jgi:hypothetical protein
MPVTGSPAAESALAVPPVETSSHPRSASALANGSKPALLETLIKALIKNPVDRRHPPV